MKARVIVIVLAVLLLAGWLAWSYAVPHTTLSEGPMNFAQAQASTPVPLPPSASNIRVATYRYMMDSTIYVKFDAPLADCRQMARQLLPQATAEAIRVTATQKEDLPPPETSKHFKKEDLAWFDAYRVAVGEVYAGGMGEKVTIWDRTDEHGANATFYYRRGD